MKNKESYLDIHKQVMIKFWDNLPWTVRDVISRDVDKTSKSLDYFSRAVNRETDRQFRERYYRY